MAALEGSRIDSGDRRRGTDVRSSSAHAMKVGSWSDEADIAFPIETSRLQYAQKPVGFARLSILLPRSLETGIHRLNLASSVRQLREAILILNLFWSLRKLMVISKCGMGASSKITQGRTMPGFGDPTSVLKIGTPGRTERVTPTSEDGPSSLIDPVILNRAQWGKDININILPNDFYMIEFMSNEEKWQAKNKGPYILDGIEVRIIDWQPNFNPRMHVLPDNKASTLGEMGGKICSSIGIELEDGKIESSSSEGDEDFEPDYDLVLEATTKGLDLDCGTLLGRYTRSVVKAGKVAESQVDRALTNTFTTLMRLGWFDGDPTK
ncbi:hypothetical protein SUGI_0821640 [Cryptomeria japonica]|nr:hypothetical protein SUGI_0821640 [Cryptomeria japonica]